MAEDKDKAKEDIKITTYDNLFDVVILEFCPKQTYKKGDIEHNIRTVAIGCNSAGIALSDAINLITERYQKKFNLDDFFIDRIVKEVYKSEQNYFGSQSIQYNLHVRNKFNEEDWGRMPYISDEIYANLPMVFQDATTVFKNKRERDVLLTGLLGVVSGTLNIFGIYRGKKTYPNLYCFIVAPAGSGKSSIMYSKKIALAKQKYIEELSEGKNVLFIPANISTASLYDHLLNNNSVGILFESEADTMKNSFKQDWGGYSDFLRKAFHAEEVSMRRKDNNTFIRIEEPRLSVILSGTRNQIIGIIPNTEDGLFSRFLFYAFKSELYWDGDADKLGLSLDDYFNELSEKFADITANTALIEQFSLTSEQMDIFHSRFEKWQIEIAKFYNDDSISIIRRLGDITFRIAMILTAIRLGEEGLKDIPIAYCNDSDFNSAFQLTEIYKHHSLFVYMTLQKENQDKTPKINLGIQLLYDALPVEFKKQDAISIGAREDRGELSASTVSKYLSKLLETGFLVQPKYGFYKKT